MAIKTSFTYNSSITGTVTDLYCRVHHPSGVIAKPLPTLVYMHGYTSTAASFSDTVLNAYADAGFLVLAFGMRGKDGATGIPEGNGLDVFDIYDGIQEAKVLFATMMDFEKLHAVGFSEGGGTILALATRFPDLFNSYVNHFGVSDYGSLADGWYYTNTSYQAGIETRLGGTPTGVPNKYLARDFRKGISKNLDNGFLYMYHAASDASVDVVHSQKVRDALNAEGKTHYQYTESETYIHGIETSGSETDWQDKFLNDYYKSWVINKSGTKVVQGWLYTKRFEIFLSNGDDASCDLQYNCTTGEFILTPVSAGAIDVTIRFFGQEVTAQITSETTFNLKPRNTVKVASGSQTEHKNYTGSTGEITYNTDTKSLVAHTGSEQTPLMKANRLKKLDVTLDTVYLTDRNNNQTIQISQAAVAKNIVLKGIESDFFEISLVSLGTATITLTTDTGGLLGNTAQISGVGSIMRVSRVVGSEDFIVKTT